MRWTIIKSILHNQVIKISYLVVIGLPIVLEILEALHLTPKVGRSIYEIFCSGVLLLVTILLYNIFGPGEITHYENIHDYVEKNAPTLNDAYPDQKKEIVMAHLDNAQSASKAKIVKLDKAIRDELHQGAKDQLISELNATVEPLYPGCINRYLQKKWYDADKNHNKAVLIICFVTSIVAIILALLVFYFRIETVFNYSTSV